MNTLVLLLSATWAPAQGPVLTTMEAPPSCGCSANGAGCADGGCCVAEGCCCQPCPQSRPGFFRRMCSRLRGNTPCCDCCQECGPTCVPGCCQDCGAGCCQVGCQGGCPACAQSGCQSCCQGGCPSCAGSCCQGGGPAWDGCGGMLPGGPTALPQQAPSPGSPVMPGVAGSDGIQARPLPAGPAPGAGQQMIPSTTAQPVPQGPQPQTGQVQPTNGQVFDPNTAPQMSEEGAPF